MNERESRAGDGEAAMEARAVAARDEVTADDVVDVLRAVREGV
ncbi:hypothetical protein [Streptomyces sp. 13-12-16]|nr:hypothetical protein [Streptomyces sp. 13-12-16]